MAPMHNEAQSEKHRPAGNVTSMSNAEIADKLTNLAQLLSAKKENPFKVKAYKRAANTIKTLSESVDELVRGGSDLTRYSGIGSAISSTVREMVLTGSLRQLE